MIPQYFIELKQMPYTPNGKIDKKALPDPKIKSESKIESVCRNERDKKLSEIISDLLKINSVDMQSSIMELGGDSLTAINLSAKIRDVFGVNLYVRDIIAKNNIYELSDCISVLSKDERTKKRRKNNGICIT